jgi:uncharacterized protein YdhG (YjbR/CyaY superfamily)
MEKITDHIPAKTVDEYLLSLPEGVRTTLEALRQAIKAAAPESEEIISYRIPTYKYFGPLVHFAAQKNHCSLTVVSPSVTKIFERELQTYKISGRTIHFSPEKPLPADLVKEIVKVRIRENEARGAGRKKK